MGAEHTTQYTDDVLQNCTPETYMLLINVNLINLILKKQLHLLYLVDECWNKKYIRLILVYLCSLKTKGMLKCPAKTLSAASSNYSEVKKTIYSSYVAVRIHSVDTWHSRVMDSKTCHGEYF